MLVCGKTMRCIKPPMNGFVLAPTLMVTCKIISGWVPRLVTVCTHGDLYRAAPLGAQVNRTMNHSVTLSCHWADQSLPYPNNVKCLARKWQVSIILKSLFWFNQGSKPWSSQSPISHNGRRRVLNNSYFQNHSFSQFPVWWIISGKSERSKTQQFGLWVFSKRGCASA